MDIFELVRLNTLHPALVHLPLGLIPLALLGYIVASLRKTEAERWLFVGDVALGCAVVTTTLAAAAGYVAYFKLVWPGTLAPWPLVHLSVGTLSLLGVWALAVARLRARRAQAPGAAEARRAARRPALAAAGVTLAALATGYIGGELLVFHGGMAVKAGADGMLSPPLTRTHAAPQSMHDSMQRARALWASSVTASTHALTEEPTAADFKLVADNAQQLQKLARWLIDWAKQPRPEHASDAEHAQNESDHAAHADDDHGDMETLAHELLVQAQQLQASATAANLPATLDTLGTLSAACANCHVRERWRETPRAPTSLRSAL